MKASARQHELLVFSSAVRPQPSQLRSLSLPASSHTFAGLQVVCAECMIVRKAMTLVWRHSSWIDFSHGVQVIMGFRAEISGITNAYSIVAYSPLSRGELIGCSRVEKFSLKVEPIR